MPYDIDFTTTEPTERSYTEKKLYEYRSEDGRENIGVIHTSMYEAARLATERSHAEGVGNRHWLHWNLSFNPAYQDEPLGVCWYSFWRDRPKGLGGV